MTLQEQYLNRLVSLLREYGFVNMNQPCILAVDEFEYDSCIFHRDILTIWFSLPCGRKFALEYTNEDGDKDAYLRTIPARIKCSHESHYTFQSGDGRYWEEKFYF